MLWPEERNRSSRILEQGPNRCTDSIGQTWFGFIMAYLLLKCIRLGIFNSDHFWCKCSKLYYMLIYRTLNSFRPLIQGIKFKKSIIKHVYPTLNTPQTIRSLRESLWGCNETVSFETSFWKAYERSCTIIKELGQDKSLWTRECGRKWKVNRIFKWKKSKKKSLKK